MYNRIILNNEIPFDYRKHATVRITCFCPFSLFLYLFAFVIAHLIIKLLMDIETYLKIVEVTSILSDSYPVSYNLQKYVEERINGSNINFDTFFNPANLRSKNKFYIRLSNPSEKNGKERGLKFCLKNNDLFKENSVPAGSSIFKFEPMLKVIGFLENNCSYCGKFLEETSNLKNDPFIKCEKCLFRTFCDSNCMVKANLEWHDLECEFIVFIQNELIIVLDSNDPKNSSENAEKLVLIILTVFRLFVFLARGKKNILNIILNMSDHIEMYKKYLDSNIAESDEQKDIFNKINTTIGPLIVSFFNNKLNKFENELSGKKTWKKANENGICRIFLLVLVNVSTVLDYSSNIIGLMFDPVFSMINHSCNPNCTLIWKDNGEITIKSIKNLKTTNEITLNYIPIHLPREVRQKILKDSFFFTCECQKCCGSDKKFDSMLPIHCRYCNFCNRGFQLSEFKKTLKIATKKLCSNCEKVLDVNFFYKRYSKLFNALLELNENNKAIEELYFLSLQIEKNLKIGRLKFRRLLALLQENYNILPLKSWPLQILIEIVKTNIQKEEPFSLNLIRLTYLSNFMIENTFEKNNVYNPNLASSLYQIAVINGDYLFNQYMVHKKQLNYENISIVGWGTVAICILSFKHFQIKFENDNNYNFNELEKCQQDMILLGKEVLRLLEKFKSEVSESKMLKKYNQAQFEQDVKKFEIYLDSGFKFIQLQQLANSTVISNKDCELLNLEFAQNTVADESEKIVKREATETFFARPEWILKL